MPNIPTTAHCDHCGRYTQVKPVGYDDDGRGKEVRLCATCRKPESVILIRAERRIKPRNNHYFTGRRIALQQQARAFEIMEQKWKDEEAAANLKGRPRPVVGSSGKTERKRKAKRS